MEESPAPFPPRYILSPEVPVAEPGLGQAGGGGGTQHAIVGLAVGGFHQELVSWNLNALSPVEPEGEPEEYSTLCRRLGKTLGT